MTCNDYADLVLKKTPYCSYNKSTIVPGSEKSPARKYNSFKSLSLRLQSLLLPRSYMNLDEAME